MCLKMCRNQTEYSMCTGHMQIHVQQWFVSYRYLCEDVNKKGQDSYKQLCSSTPEPPLQVLWHGRHLERDEQK